MQFFLTYGSNISRNRMMYNESVPFASNFILIELYYKWWINKLPLTFFEVESCVTFQEFRNCHWLPAALNSASQCRCIVPLAPRFAGVLRHETICSARENHTLKTVACVKHCTSHVSLLLMHKTRQEKSLCHLVVWRGHNPKMYKHLLQSPPERWWGCALSSSFPTAFQCAFETFLCCPWLGST